MAKKDKHKKRDLNKTELANRIANQSRWVSNAYSSVEDSLFRVIRAVSSLVDKVIFSKYLMPLVALLLAVSLYISVNYDSENNPFMTPLSSARTLNNVKVNALYNDESFEIRGLPETCSITLTGEAANVTNAATREGYCQVNLEGLTEGTHTVSLNASGYGDNVNAITTPSDVTITLERKTTRQYEVDYDFINLDALDSRYILSEPTFPDGSRVNIRASKTTLDSIAFVKVLIDASGVTGDFEQEAKLVAYDANGNVVSADIIPSTIKVEVSVTSPHKVVPINLNITGTVPEDMAIESVSMDQQTTIIYAPENVLDTIDQVSVNLDASSLLRDTQMAAPITLPEGVSSADVTMVNLSITLGEKETKMIDNVPINYRNNTNNYQAEVADNVTSVNVRVEGTKENIEAIDISDIYVYVDMADLEPGTYDLPLEIQLNSSNHYVELSSERATLKITLIGSEEN